MQRPQALLKQAIGDATSHILLQHVEAELEDLLKLVVHLCLELGDLRAQDGAFGKVEHFLTQQSQDFENVLASALACHS